MKFQIIDHGPDHSDYFQGCGVSFTEYTHCFTGTSSDPYSAFGDAMEGMCQALNLTQEQVSEIEREGNNIFGNRRVAEYDLQCEEIYHYVSIQIKL